MENPFGTESRLSLTAGKSGERTVLEECFCRAPFKLMKPFYPNGKGDMELMLMSVSAGIMAGDSQEIQIQVKAGARLSITTQSYEKLHKMAPGASASRKSVIRVEDGGFLSYQPLPVIPFAQSDFSGDTEIILEGPDAGLIYSEILSCGRAARGERFQYRRYQNRIAVSCEGVLRYADNTLYLPAGGGAGADSSLPFMEMEETGAYEGHTHLANLLILNRELPEGWPDEVRLLFSQAEEEEIQGGVTRLSHGYVVKILGNPAQELLDLIEKIRMLGEI